MQHFWELFVLQRRRKCRKSSITTDTVSNTGSGIVQRPFPLSNRSTGPKERTGRSCYRPGRPTCLLHSCCRWQRWQSCSPLSLSSLFNARLVSVLNDLARKILLSQIDISPLMLLHLHHGFSTVVTAAPVVIPLLVNLGRENCTFDKDVSNSHSQI